VTATTVYVDVDGTLVGPGGDVLSGDGRRLVDALLRCREADIEVVPVTGRGRVQVRELCRLLGFRRGIGVLGCVHLEGHEVRYELGAFPFIGETPVERMFHDGVLDVVADQGLEPHEPWNEGREATYLLRGRVDEAVVTARVAAAGHSWCELVDNGVLRRGGHVYHLVPVGTGKAHGVEVDRRHHGLARGATVYVGDSASDLACADQVGECWLVANADPALVWPHRTAGAYGDGVTEVLERLLG
jgi:hydroxymethylpyrimidine pyrophosphatase-like HAD family hydrolase